jgi:mevalonate kinase
MKTSFFAPGKIMLTAEYTVLRGARSLALPAKPGQHLEVQPGNTGLSWKSFDVNNEIWFQCTFSNDLEILSASDDSKAGLLQKLLQNAALLAPEFDFQNKNVVTRLEFPNSWGLGTSSSLVALIAKWSACDAMKLFFSAMSGSGYDVACAMTGRPVFYQVVNGYPIVSEVQINFPFSYELFFVHLGQKQNSAAEVVRFAERSVSDAQINAITSITEHLPQCQSISDFEDFILDHEDITSAILGIPSIKQQLFPDYPRAIKSLGAWGGDLVLVCGDDADRSYFKDKGYTEIISWDAMFPEF